MSPGTETGGRPNADVISSATGARLETAARAVGLHVPPGDHGPARALGALAAAVAQDGDPALIWLMLTATAGRYPEADDVRAVRRVALRGGPTSVALAVLDRALPLAAASGTADSDLRVVVGGVLVDLDACGRSDFHNGIQRVARETAKAWEPHGINVVAWTDNGAVTRAMSATEESRAARWGRAQDQISPVLSERSGARSRRRARANLVIPWRATYVLAEVPLPSRCASLAALAEFSGTDVVAIGYDAIPLITADLRPFGEPDAFAAYLTVIKHARRVAGISRSATEEFAGYVHMLSSQGLRGPEVSEVLLPSDVPPAPPRYERHEPERPVVLSVGRFEPHKNHGAILHAAEQLWREGLDFELHFIGGRGWSMEAVDRQFAELAARGRPVVRLGAVPDDELWRRIREATFTVFISLHEGFGLPVSESLACGTPVVTTRYGSQGEIAEGGGCLTVDPREDQEVTDALRRLLTEPELLAELRRQAAGRPTRTWAEYANELWTALVTGGAR